MLDAFWHDLWLFAPAFVANAAPVVAKKLPLLSRWDTPIHAGILGKNKTVRGLASGVAAAVIVSALQYALEPSFLPDLSDVLVSFPIALLAGAALGGGALLGDIAESSLKRRMGIPPGGALPVIDGIDYILGALLLLSPLYVPALSSVVLLLIVAPVASLFANMAAYSLRWKQQWY